MPEFSRYVNPSLEFGQRFSCQVLIGQWPIDNSRIEKRYTAIHRFMQQSDTLFLIRVLAAVVSHAHHAEAEC